MTPSPDSSSWPVASTRGSSWCRRPVIDAPTSPAKRNSPSRRCAGVAARPEIMAMSQERRGAGGRLSVVAAHGLGLFDGAIVEQHFDGPSGRLERFTDLLRDSAHLDRLVDRPGTGVRMLGLAVE